MCAPRSMALRREFAVGAGAAHDLDTLLYAFLDELLFCFLTEMFVCKALRVTRLQRGPAWALIAVGCAEGPALYSGCTTLCCEDLSTCKALCVTRQQRGPASAQRRRVRRTLTSSCCVAEATALAGVQETQHCGWCCGSSASLLHPAHWLAH